jgi:ADP-ribose pyrophosphatase YjhB (NUDIX family)
MDDWLTWINKIKAISQIGKSYSKDAYDLERYDQLSGIADSMYTKLSNDPIEKVKGFFIPEKGYATAKVDLRAAIFKNHQILLVREKRDNKWAMPGGWADVGGTPTQGIEREVLEETGYQVQAVRLISVRDQSLHGYTPRYPVHVYKLFFLCEITGGASTENTEISEISFFPLEALPELSTGTTLEADIHSSYDYFRNPAKLVNCD